MKSRRRTTTFGSSSWPRRAATSSGAGTHPTSRSRCSGTCPCSRTWALKPETPSRRWRRKFLPDSSKRTCGFERTKTPRPCSDSISPSALRIATARRTVGRLVLNRFASSFSDGSCAPGSSRPSTMEPRSSSKRPDTGSDLAIQVQPIACPQLADGPAQPRGSRTLTWARDHAVRRTEAFRERRRRDRRPPTIDSSSSAAPTPGRGSRRAASSSLTRPSRPAWSVRSRRRPVCASTRCSSPAYTRTCGAGSSRSSSDAGYSVDASTYARSPRGAMAQSCATRVLHTEAPPRAALGCAGRSWPCRPSTRRDSNRRHAARRPISRLRHLRAGAIRSAFRMSRSIRDTARSSSGFARLIA